MADTVQDAPAGFGIRTYKCRLARTLPMQRATYTFDDYRLDFGGEMWVAEYTLPEMTVELAAQVAAWLDTCLDVGKVMRLAGSPTGANGKFGTADNSNMSVVGAHSTGARNLLVQATAPGVTLLKGSYVSLANRLHQLRTDVTFNGGAGSDEGTMELRPRLRDAKTGGENVVVNASGVKSLWRIDDTDWDVRDRLEIMRGRTLKLTEAIRK